MTKLLIIYISLLYSFIAGQSISWSEGRLKDHWIKNGADEIEGIYENTIETSFWDKYKLGVLKTNNGYSIIYLYGAKGNDSWRWHTGDIKAFLTPTVTKYIFKTKWFMSDKSYSENLYVRFESGMMNTVWTNELPTVTYLKLFPTANDDIPSVNNSPMHISGTGFAISPSGIIVTNFHLVNNAKIIKVRGINSDFNRDYNARLLVSDKNNDLALIKIEEDSLVSLIPIPYTIKTEVSSVGENIFVLGYPLRATMGEEIKLTDGIISSKTGYQGDITSYQISAPIQPGNSGGPLFDSKGNLIGIINAKHSVAENVSYAIKVNYLLNLFDLLQEQPQLPTKNTLNNGSLSEQVDQIKKFIYILEVN